MIRFVLEGYASWFPLRRKSKFVASFSIRAIDFIAQFPPSIPRLEAPFAMLRPNPYFFKGGSLKIAELVTVALKGAC